MPEALGAGEAGSARYRARGPRGPATPPECSILRLRVPEGRRQATPAWPRLAVPREPTLARERLPPRSRCGEDPQHSSSGRGLGPLRCGVDSRTSRECRPRDWPGGKDWLHRATCEPTSLRPRSRTRPEAGRWWHPGSVRPRGSEHRQSRRSSIEPSRLENNRHPGDRCGGDRRRDAPVEAPHGQERDHRPDP